LFFTSKLARKAPGAAGRPYSAERGMSLNLASTKARRSHGRQAFEQFADSLRAYVMANHHMDPLEFHSISGGEMIQKFGYRPK
jgi:hypothetical protein